MRTKYITSCTRPPVWRHLRVSRSSLSLDSMMAYLPASLLPPSPWQDRGQRYRTTQNAFTPAISPHRAFNLSQQLGLCAQSLAKETGQPLRCLAYPNSCRLYLVYSRPARCTARPTVGQSNYSKTTCSNLDYDITTTGNQNPDFKHVASVAVT